MVKWSKKNTPSRLFFPFTPLSLSDPFPLGFSSISSYPPAPFPPLSCLTPPLFRPNSLASLSLLLSPLSLSYKHAKKERILKRA